MYPHKGLTLSRGMAATTDHYLELQHWLFNFLWFKRPYLTWHENHRKNRSVLPCASVRRHSNSSVMVWTRFSRSFDLKAVYLRGFWWHRGLYHVLIPWASSNSTLKNLNKPFKSQLNLFPFSVHVDFTPQFKTEFTHKCFFWGGWSYICEENIYKSKKYDGLCITLGLFAAVWEVKIDKL